MQGSIDLGETRVEVGRRVILEASERGLEQTVVIRVVEGEIQENKKYQI